MGKFIIAAIAMLAFYPGHLLADTTKPVSKNENNDVKDIIRHVLESNEVFVKRSTSEYFKPFIHGQNPMATMITCADSRLHTHALDVHPDGDLFLVRNIGNQVPTAEGSVEYGVRHLHTPVLFIIGHSSCGAVEAAMSDHSKLEPAIKRELDTMKVAGTKTDDAAEVKKSVETNVHHQVSYALTKFADEIRKGSLTVIGGIYDFKNEYNQGSGRLVLININGETNPDVIRKIQPAVHFP